MIYSVSSNHKKNKLQEQKQNGGQNQDGRQAQSIFMQIS
jgi:hypothetical protein